VHVHQNLGLTWVDGKQGHWVLSLWEFVFGQTGNHILSILQGWGHTDCACYVQGGSGIRYCSSSFGGECFSFAFALLSVLHLAAVISTYNYDSYLVWNLLRQKVQFLFMLAVIGYHAFLAY
jgi:hypothetical protein